MEIIKIIREEEKNLKDLNIKVVSLDVENGEDDFYFLNDDLSEELKQKLEEKKFKFFPDLKIYYDLSYSQGSGFSFVGTIETKKARFTIKPYGHYSHENAKTINTDCLFIGKKEVYDFTDKQIERVNKIEEEFNKIYVSICKDLEKYGYKEIELREEINILSVGFNKFLNENDINCNLELFNFLYSTEEKKGFIKICDSGNTNINGLWIEDFKIKSENKIKAYSDILEYQEKTII